MFYSSKISLPLVVLICLKIIQLSAISYENDTGTILKCKNNNSNNECDNNNFTNNLTNTSNTNSKATLRSHRKSIAALQTKFANTSHISRRDIHKDCPEASNHLRSAETTTPFSMQQQKIHNMRITKVKNHKRYGNSSELLSESMSHQQEVSAVLRTQTPYTRTKKVWNWKLWEPKDVGVEEESKATPQINDSSVLVDFLIKNMTLSAEHRLSESCRDASDSLQIPPVVRLLNFIATRYLYHCITIILYDDFYENQYSLLQSLMATYPLTYVHGKVMRNNSLKAPLLLDPPDLKCRDFLLLLSDLDLASVVLGDHSISRVIIVSQASRWRINEFLSSPLSHNMVNLLLVGNQNTDRQHEEDKFRTKSNVDLNIYTHNLFVDGLGSSALRILTAWRCGALTRPNVNLFPAKMRRGFMGHRFIVAAGNQPPFVVKRGYFFNGQRVETSWDGLEIRFLWLMGEMLNFSFIVTEPPEAFFLPAAPNAVVKEVLAGRADIGIGGIYTTPSRINVLTISSPHTQDCVTFMTLTSTAIPRFRAIMGPFHWTVWLALTLTYLLAIFPIAFSDSHSLTHLFKNPWQIENMFWYVFGTFTNCFTFKGEHSWSNSDKAATRMLIGWYWVFSIIIAACYTGSIIAFVTLPVYPAYVDNCNEVIHKGLQVGTLSEGGWRYWFNDSADPSTTKLFKDMEYLPDLESAMHNVTFSYYRNYAFLGSWSLLDYIIRINYTVRSEGKRSYLHLGRECFVPFSVAMMFPPRSPHSDVMSQMLLRIVQSGLSLKLKRDMEWDLRRSSSGKLLAASGGPSLRGSRPEERKLSLEDITGTFLLLGAGFGMGALVLFVEILAWVVKKIKTKFFLKENTDHDFIDADNDIPGDNHLNANTPGDIEHEPENNALDYCEEEVKLTYIDKDDFEQPDFSKGHIYGSSSADARIRTYEDSEQQSPDHLSSERKQKVRCLIPLQSMASLPATSSPKLKKRRMHTPRPSYTFTIERDAEMSGYNQNVSDNTNYNEYRLYGDLAISSLSSPQFQGDNLTVDYENAGDKYFGAKVQKESYEELIDTDYEFNHSREQGTNDVLLMPSEFQNLKEDLERNSPFSS